MTNLTIYSILFYLIAALMIVSTGLAITRKNMVHAVLYLVVSFMAGSLLFFLLGAPLLAILQVIIYAGAIMVLFLFIVMMIKVDPEADRGYSARTYLAVAGVSGIYFAAAILLMRFSGAAARRPMAAAIASPADFGRYVFTHHWLAIEIVSLLLLVVLVGALHLGQGRARRRAVEKEGK